MFGFDPSGKAFLEIAQKFCVITCDSKEMANTLIVRDHPRLQKRAFRYEQNNANVDRLPPSEIWAILDNAVMAFNWTHDLPSPEKSIVSWGGSNNLVSPLSKPIQHQCER
jgi:hypothetical protein